MDWSSTGSSSGASTVTTGMPAAICSEMMGMSVVPSVGAMTQPWGWSSAAAWMKGSCLLMSQSVGPCQLRSTLDSVAAVRAPHSIDV